MVKEIENFKTEMINIHFVSKNIEHYKINVEFAPDEIVLKYISIFDNDGANTRNMYIIKSNLVEGGNLISLPGPTDGTNTNYTESVDIPFNNRGRPISGTYEFSITEMDGTIPTNKDTIDYMMCLTFIFIKFKSDVNI